AKGDSIVKQAIREILGFTIAEKALQDVKAIRKNYQSEMAKADKQGIVAEKQKKITALENQLASYKEAIQRSEQAISYYEATIAEIDEQLQSSDSKTIQQIHNLRLEKEKQLKREKGLQQDALEEKVGLISDYATTVFGLKLAQTALDFIDESEYKGTIPAPYNEQLFQDILKEALCICGADIKPGTEAFNKINALLKQASDPMLENRVRKARSQLTSIQQNAIKSKKLFSSNIHKLAQAETNIVRLTKEIADLSVKIQGLTDLESINNLEKERSRANNNLRQELQSLGNAKAKLENSEKELPALKNEISRLDAYSSEMLRYKDLASYAEQVETLIDSTLQNAEKDVEKRIIEKVNKYLSMFVRQDYKAKLNP
ncbi:hypothetical protein ORJ04_22940, partial [Rheinheimera baltica]